MKKKFMLIGIMLVVCFGILFGIKSIQKTPVSDETQNNSVAAENTANKEVQKEENKQEENKDNQTLVSSESSTKGSIASNVESNAGKTQEQNKVNETKTTAKTSTAASNSIEKSNNTTSSNSTINNNTKTDTQKPVEQEPNLIITNTITGEKILNIRADFEGVTVADATKKALDSAGKSYKISGIGESVYFSSINGLRERGSGASSGWCYYVNGKKLSVSSGTYTLKKEDKLEWKYLKDGVSN